MRIWIDISLYRRTSGTAFGIARVEEQLVKRLPKKQFEVCYFWMETDSLARFSNEIFKDSQKANSTKSSVHISRYLLLNRLKSEPVIIRTAVIITNLISFFPAKMAEKTWAYGRNFYSQYRDKNLYQSSKSTKGSSRSYFIDTSPKPEPQDLFLIASNDWERRSYEHLENQLKFKPRLAFIVYDLIPYTNPEFAVDLETASKFTYWIGDVAQKSEFLFFISEFTESCFEKMLIERKITSIASKSIIRLPSGIPVVGVEEEPDFSAKLEDQFVLVVCTLEVRKNHKVLLRAASEALRLGEFFPQLVFVGAKGWGYEEIRRDIEVNEQLKLKVMHEAGVSDSQLRWLYRNCALVAYPSFIEGLGLPIIEAKQFGKRVLASSAEVFSEILDEGDVTISPNDVMEWKIQIQQKCIEKTTHKAIDRTSNSWDQVIDDIVDSLN